MLVTYNKTRLTRKISLFLDNFVLKLKYIVFHFSVKLVEFQDDINILALESSLGRLKRAEPRALQWTFYLNLGLHPWVKTLSNGSVKRIFCHGPIFWNIKYRFFVWKVLKTPFVKSEETCFNLAATNLVVEISNICWPSSLSSSLSVKLGACLIETHWIWGSFLQLDIKGSFLWSKLPVGL